MIKAHQIKLYPNENQDIFFRNSCGVKRFAYNWALNVWNELYQQGQQVGAYQLVKMLNAIKRKDFPWMQETGKTCSQHAIHDLSDAWSCYFRKLKDGSLAKEKSSYIKNRKSRGLKVNEKKLINFGKPKFKKKGYCNDSFITIENHLGFKQKDYKIWIRRLGWVKCAENLRFSGKVNNVTVKRIADMWFAVVNIEIPVDTPVVNENQVIIGVDIGIKSMAVTSDGVVYDNPKALKKGMKALKRKQRSLSRKVKGSKNRQKQQMVVAKAHYKIACIRKDALHKATTNIVDSAGVIVLEDLNVAGMIKNHNLAQSISDVSLSEFRRQIEYKAKWQGKEVIIADRWYASSKTCSCCGWKDESLTLVNREFRCKDCGLEIDRDLNAAINLANYGTMLRLSKSEACADENQLKRDGNSVDAEMQLFSSSMKQEIAIFDNNFNKLTTKL